MAQFWEGKWFKAWRQWLEEEEEERGKWEEVSAVVEFSAGYNRDGGGGGPIEGRDN